jgi:hypothetical protein
MYKAVSPDKKLYLLDNYQRDGEQEKSVDVPTWRKISFYH